MARIHLGPLERAIVVEDPDTSLDGLLEAQGLSVHRVRGTAPDAASMIRLMQETRAQVIFKRSRVPVSRELVEACPDLLLVQLCCIGDDSVDKQACADHGVMVLNDPISNNRSVVELAIAHLIGLSRRLVETDAACRAGVWEKSNTGRYEIMGKTLGVGPDSSAADVLSSLKKHLAATPCALLSRVDEARPDAAMQVRDHAGRCLQGGSGGGAQAASCQRPRQRFAGHVVLGN